MPTREEITYILVDDQMPHHKKIAPLTDAAFRLLIDVWCWTSGKDGKMPKRVWNGMGTPKSRKALIEAGLIELVDHDALVHDYLDIQRSLAEITGLKAKKTIASIKGNHRRHHVNKGVRSDDCPLCLKGVA